MGKAKTEGQWVHEALALVHDLHHHVFFKKEPMRAPRGTTGEYTQFHYVVFRVGMGTVAKFRSPAGLCKFLQRQLSQEEANDENRADGG